VDLGLLVLLVVFKLLVMLGPLVMLVALEWWPWC